MSIDRDIRIKYKDLQQQAKHVYDEAGKRLRGKRGLRACDDIDVPALTAAKLMEVQLKAIRLQAELREKALRPEQIESFEQQLRRVEERIISHHAGGIDRAGTASVREGEPPAWEQ